MSNQTYHLNRAGMRVRPFVSAHRSPLFAIGEADHDGPFDPPDGLSPDGFRDYVDGREMGRRESHRAEVRTSNAMRGAK